MPILKQSPVSHSKKRPRLDRAMISAPLGDFRHTMHIGRGGDAFGDTSFLSNHGGPKANGLPPDVAVSPGSFSSPGSVADGFELLSSPGSGNGVIQSQVMSPSDGSYMVMQHPEMTEQLPQTPPNGEDWKVTLESPSLEHAESLLSFQLDLGPSILDEVLGVMDKDWNCVRGKDQEPMSDERSSPVRCLHRDHEDEEEDEEEDEGQGYSFEDEQDEEIGL